MPRKNFSAEQIVTLLRQIEVSISHSQAPGANPIAKCFKPTELIWLWRERLQLEPRPYIDRS